MEIHDSHPPSSDEEINFHPTHAEFIVEPAHLFFDPSITVAMLGSIVRAGRELDYNIKPFLRQVGDGLESHEFTNRHVIVYLTAEERTPSGFNTLVDAIAPNQMNILLQQLFYTMEIMTQHELRRIMDMYKPIRDSYFQLNHEVYETIPKHFHAKTLHTVQDQARQRRSISLLIKTVFYHPYLKRCRKQPLPHPDVHTEKWIRKSVSDMEGKGKGKRSHQTMQVKHKDDSESESTESNLSESQGNALRRRIDLTINQDDVVASSVYPTSFVGFGQRFDLHASVQFYNKPIDSEPVDAADAPGDGTDPTLGSDSAAPSQPSQSSNHFVAGSSSGLTASEQPVSQISGRGQGSTASVPTFRLCMSCFERSCIEPFIHCCRTCQKHGGSRHGAACSIRAGGHQNNEDFENDTQTYYRPPNALCKSGCGRSAYRNTKFCCWPCQQSEAGIHIARCDHENVLPAYPSPKAISPIARMPKGQPLDPSPSVRNLVGNWNAKAQPLSKRMPSNLRSPPGLTKARAGLESQFLLSAANVPPKSTNLSCATPSNFQRFNSVSPQDIVSLIDATDPRIEQIPHSIPSRPIESDTNTQIKIESVCVHQAQSTVVASDREFSLPPTNDAGTGA